MKQEITLEALQNDYDWGEVFGEGSGEHTTDDVESAPPGANVSTEPVFRANVAEVIGAVNGENDGPDWVGLFRMNDGRFLVATGECDYTGWGCRSGNTLTVFVSLGDAIKYGLDDSQKLRLLTDVEA